MLARLRDRPDMRILTATHDAGCRQSGADTGNCNYQQFGRDARARHQDTVQQGGLGLRVCRLLRRASDHPAHPHLSTGSPIPGPIDQVPRST